MNKVVMIFATSEGLVAVEFASQPDMEAWLDQNPDADEIAQTMVPIATKGALVNSINKSRA